MKKTLAVILIGISINSFAVNKDSLDNTCGSTVPNPNNITSISWVGNSIVTQFNDGSTYISREYSDSEIQDNSGCYYSGRGCIL